MVRRNDCQEWPSRAQRCRTVGRTAHLDIAKSDFDGVETTEVSVRALFVNENIGGHETVHVHLERALAARDDIEADFFHVGPRGPLRRVVGASIPGLGRLDLDFQPLRAQLASSGTVRKALRTRYADYDVLHVYTQNAALLSTRILREMPSVVSIDSTNDLNAYRMPHRHATRWTPKVLPVSRAVERRVFEAATLVVPNSDYVARSLRTTYGVTDERVRIVPMGVEVPSDLPPRDRDDGMPSIVFVGRQLEAKGGQRLLALHRERWSRRSTLDLVTTDPVEAHDGVRVHDDIVPGDGRLDAILRRGAVFVFPSEIDQSPNAVLEAMAMGLPVVALDVGAVPEMVEHGVTGYVVERRDDAGLVRAVEDLLDDPDLRARMGAAGHARARALYEINRQAGVLVEVLHEAMALHR